MIAGIRLIIMGFAVLTVIYIVLSLWSRWKCRQRLAREFDEQGLSGDRDDYIATGLRDYDHSLRRRLILGVYVVPMVVFGTLIYVMNFM